MKLHERLKGFENSSTHARPKRMLQRDRLPDQNFSKWHELYKRFGKEDFVEDRLIPARIPYRNSSVNWSKYSKPWDVIFEYPQMGFCRILVRNLPRELPKLQPENTTAKLHNFIAEHAPIEDNFGHAEIVTFKDGIKLIENYDLPSTVKKELRTIVSDKSLILHFPKTV